MTVTATIAAAVASSPVTAGTVALTVPERVTEYYGSYNLLYRTEGYANALDIKIGRRNSYLPEIVGWVNGVDEDGEFTMDGEVNDANSYNREMKDPSFQTADTYPTEAAATLECTRKMRSYLERLRDTITDDISIMLAELDEIDAAIKPAAG